MEQTRQVDYQEKIRVTMEQTMLNNHKILALAPKNSGITLMMRHSLRDEIPEGEFGNEIPLTEKGKKFAQKFGSELSIPVVEVYSSPLQRCVETGSYLLDGQNNRQCTVIKDQRLGDPGAFIDDAELAGSYFLKNGAQAVYKEALADKNSWGIQPLEKGADMLLEMIFAPPHNKGLRVLITHDSILGFLLSHLLNQKILTYDFWPEMLEGALFWQNGPDRFLAWRGRKYRLKSSA